MNYSLEAPMPVNTGKEKKYYNCRLKNVLIFKEMQKCKKGKNLL